MVCQFPLGKTGGLIEARLVHVSPPQKVGGFRWVKPAASLKHDQFRRHAARRIGVSAG